jgi:hypothetical protein
VGGKAALSTSTGDKGFILGLRKAFDSALSSAIYGGAAPSAGVPATGVPGGGGKVPQPPQQAPTDKQRAAQAAAEAKEREKKAKQEEKERLAAEKKAKEEEKKKKKAKQEDKGEDGDKPSGFFSRMIGAVSGVKQVDLGEDNKLYYNETLGCWVERGKEDEVAATAAAAPPPMMASFASGQSGSFSDQGGSSQGPSRSETPMDPSMSQAPSPFPGGPGMMAPGGPPGGNMFKRETSRGARSRYVDTLNPGAASGSPSPGMGGAAPNGMGMPPAGMPGMPGGGGAAAQSKPKPKYTVFVPQAAAQQQEQPQQQQQQQQQQQPQDGGAGGAPAYDSGAMQ